MSRPIFKNQKAAEIAIMIDDAMDQNQQLASKIHDLMEYVSLASQFKTSKNEILLHVLKTFSKDHNGNDTVFTNQRLIEKLTKAKANNVK